MATTGTDHTVILVKDIDDGVRNYQEHLGLVLHHRAESKEAGMRQAFFDLADGSFLELIAPTDEASELHAVVQARGEGVHVLALEVDNFDEHIAGLQQRGVKLIGVGTPQVFVHPRSANGVMIQLWPKSRAHRWRKAVDS